MQALRRNAVLDVGAGIERLGALGYEQRDRIGSLAPLRERVIRATRLGVLAVLE